jgi:hypothetical protein
LDEIETSRLVVESLLSPTMSKNIQTRFDHDGSFFYYPGNVMLMMVLEVCKASVSYDIEGAQEKFDTLILDNFPGEDISALGYEAQNQVKILQTGYALPIRTGSKYLGKLTATRFERMHRKVFAIYDDVKENGGPIQAFGSSHPLLRQILCYNWPYRLVSKASCILPG